MSVLRSSQSFRRARSWVLLGCAVVVAGLLSPFGCQRTDSSPAEVSRAEARKISSRSELIGGPTALGEVGDFLLQNDKIRVIVQREGHSRGFGVYGGGIIDADRVRPVAEGSVGELNGRDQLGELFPVFFIQAMEPEVVKVHHDGADGRPAVVRVEGHASDFLTLAQTINQAIMNSHELPESIIDVLGSDGLDGERQLAYSVDYELSPGARHVKLTTRMTNISGKDLPIPSELAEALLGFLVPEMDRLDVPLGYVLLYGAGNRVFAPGFGYNVRFTMDDRYKTTLPFPALSGIVTDSLISTSTNGISYGFFGASDPEVPNFAKNRVNAEGANYYTEAFGDDVSDNSLLIPFIASSFTGVFYAQAPPIFEKDASFAFVNYFVVGDGDAASVLDTYQAMTETVTGELRGRVRDVVTLQPVADASVLIYDAQGRAINQVHTDAHGSFRANLTPGDYRARVEKEPVISDAVAFSVRADEAVFVELGKPGVARLSVQVRDPSNQPLPAKVTVTGRYNDSEIAGLQAGQRPWEFLFDLEAGQHWLISDQVPDDPSDPETLQFIQAVEFTDHGQAVLELPTNRDYTVYVSRGLEYSREVFTLSASELGAGRAVSRAVQLERVVDTKGYVSADFHIHAAPSIDSDVSLSERVLSGAAEGLEIMVATDHNMITDYTPTIEREGLTAWMSAMVGLELSTLESGHFNGYPLRRDASLVTRGSFDWAGRPPDELFSEIRALGSISPDKTLVQVNHARDSLLGYFSEYELDELTGELAPPQASLDFSAVLAPSGPAFFDEEGNSTFSYDFDVLEVVNGPLQFQSFHTTMPTDTTGVAGLEEVADQLPPPGTVLCEEDRVAFPGVVDDWFNLLNLGYPVAGVGNSDSHHSNDLGYPRTYVRLGTDDPSYVDEAAVVDALRGHRASISFGPFVELFVNGAPIGSTVMSTGGELTLEVRLAAPDWVDVKRFMLVVNGERQAPIPVTMVDGRFTWTGNLTVDRDSWILVIAQGDETLFPIVPPVDIPPVLLGDAFSSLAGPLGLASGALGELESPRVGFARPLSLTNPIWIDVGADGLTPPGVLPRRCEGLGVVEVLPESDSDADSGAADAGEAGAEGQAEGSRDGRDGGKAMSSRRSRRGAIRKSFGFPRVHGDIYDIRSIFEAHVRHSHAH